MSYQEAAKSMIDKSEDKHVFLINIMETPNTETLAAFNEGKEMFTNGTGQQFTNTKDLFAALEE